MPLLLPIKSLTTAFLEVNHGIAALFQSRFEVAPYIGVEPDVLVHPNTPEQVDASAGFVVGLVIAQAPVPLLYSHWYKYPTVLYPQFELNKPQLYV
ncbi:hypothetical protein D3C73_1246630 [compost metagenome]